MGSLPKEREHVDERTGDPLISSNPIPRGSWRRAIRAIEREWLGFASEPLEERLRSANWTPEPRDRVCPRCARSVGAFGATPDGCDACAGTRPAWARVVRLGEYEGVLGEIVREVKFHRFRTLGVGIGRLLGQRLRHELVGAGLEPSRTAIVPLPMSRRRYLERGIDHALAISRGVASATGGRIVRLLSRSHGPSQLAVPASDRKNNVSKTFRGRSGGAIPRGVEAWVIVDDVRTTGASLQAAARALREGLAKDGERNGVRAAPIWGCVVASSEEG